MLNKKLKRVADVYRRDDNLQPGQKRVVDVVDIENDPCWQETYKEKSEMVQTNGEPLPVIDAQKIKNFIHSQKTPEIKPLKRYMLSANELVSFENEPHGEAVDLISTLNSNERKAGKFIAPAGTVLANNSAGIRRELCNFEVIPYQKIFINNNDDGQYKWQKSVIKIFKQGTHKEITIANSEVKNLAKILKDIDPALFIDNPQEFDKYVATQFETYDMRMLQYKVSTIPGWVKVNNSGMMVYNSAKYEAVHVSRKLLIIQPDENFAGIVKDGNSFLEIGHGGKEIKALFVAAHLGFLCPFLEKINIPPTFIGCLVGPSNSFKTSVVKALFNLFVPENEQMFSFKSTTKGLEMAASKCRHESFPVDDVAPAVSFGSKKNLEKSLDNVESLSRIYGDESVQVKSNPAWDVDKNFAPKGFCIITAESGLLQGAFSTRSRQLWIQCDRNTFDGPILQRFQENPLIMQKYFSFFVDFIEKNQVELIKHLPIFKDSAEKYLKNNDCFGIKTGRIRHAFLVMLTATAVIDWFNCAVCGTPLTDGLDFNESLKNLFVVSESATQEKDPVKLFMETLREAIKNGDVDIASDRYEFKNGFTMYIGFYEDDKALLYIKPREIYKKVMELCGENGVMLPLAKNELFNQLKEADIILADKDSALRKLSFQINNKRLRLLCIKKY
ncbi:hypothetical protein [Pectinatus frisingensis]|uniref:hypothetical protein n=1 Tax=Pectinatus frisingensis TaxID=865 RepID=UPI0018C4978A|nr:hypothetical protein [Pectinatus frisingensis]